MAPARVVQYGREVIEFFRRRSKGSGNSGPKARPVQPPAGLRLPPAFLDSIVKQFERYPNLSEHSDKVFETVASVLNRMLPLDFEGDQVDTTMQALSAALEESEENFGKMCEAIDLCVRASAASRKPDLWLLWKELHTQGGILPAVNMDIVDGTRNLVQTYRDFQSIWPEGKLSLATLAPVEAVLGQKKATRKRNDLERVCRDVTLLLKDVRHSAEIVSFSRQFASIIRTQYSKGSVFFPFELKQVEKFGEINRTGDPDYINRLNVGDRRDYVKYLFSLQSEHPDLLELDNFASRISGLDPQYYQTFVDFRARMRGPLADQQYGQFLDLMTSSKIPEERRFPLVDLLSKEKPSHIAPLVALITDISKLDDGDFREECYEVLCNPETDIEAVLSDLIQKVYAQGLKEFAIRFPEKPLEEVLEEFLDDSTHTEVVSTAELDTAARQYREIVEASVGIQALTTEELGAQVEALRAQERPSVTQYLALARESFRRIYGVYPYNTQILAVLLMLNKGQDEESKGVYAQIKTGEGKSLVIPLLAGYFALQPENDCLEKRDLRKFTVDIVTSNDYLAERDARKFEPLFRTFGISSDYFTLDEHEEIRPDTGVLYSTPSSLILHYLLEGKYGRAYFDDRRMRICIADEADNLLLDSFAQSLRIAVATESDVLNDECARFLMQYVDNNGYTGSAEQLDDVRSEARSVLEDDRQSGVWKITQFSPQELKVFLYSAYESRTKKRDVHYVVEATDPDGKNREIVIVDDQNTGRKMQSTQWSFGLHKFVSIREKLTPPPDLMVAVEHSHHAFFRQFRKLFCMSGTIGDNVDRGELRRVYGLNGFDVPPHRKCIRKDEGITLCETRDEQTAAIIDRIRTGNDRPTLIICENVRESEALRRKLELEGIKSQLLNDVNNQDENGVPRSEAEIIEGAGDLGMVTIATNVLGRGSDIIIGPEAAARGGVHEITTFIPVNVRVEFQARGRSGRQGNPGSSEIITYQKDNPFFERLMPSEGELISMLREQFGAQSPQLSAMIEWMRESRNVLASEQQLKKCAMDEEHDRIVGAFFTDIQNTARALMGNLSRRKLSVPPDAVKILADKIFERWMPLYVGYDISKAYCGILCEEAVDAAVSMVQAGRKIQFKEEEEGRYAKAKERMHDVFTPYAPVLLTLGPEYKELIQRTFLSRAAALTVMQNESYYDYWKEWIEKLRKTAESLCEEQRKRPGDAFRRIS